MQTTGRSEARTDGFLSFARHADHNPWLDMLRTLAILLVLFRHGALIAGDALPSPFLRHLLTNGWVGVDLFFVLSGYLIAAGLIRRASCEAPFDPIGYARDRILRIVPAYYAALFLCVAGVFPGFPVHGPPALQSILAHLLFLQDYRGSDINVVFWSLGVEEKFYILAPLVLLALRGCKSMPACAALGLGLFLISPLARGISFEALSDDIGYQAFFQTMRSPFHMSLDGFVVGMMAAIAQSRGWTVPPGKAMAGLCVGMGLLVILLGTADLHARITRFDAWGQPSLFAMLFGGMLICALSLSQRKLRLDAFFRVNARLSYALYLVHYPLIPLAVVFSGGKHGPAFWASYLLLAYAGALLLHFGVEKPFLQWKAHLNATAARPRRDIDNGRAD